MVVQNAVIAAENYSFRTDPGVSFTGVARAALNDLFGSGGKQGGSTITQQYVKNAFLSQDQSFARKIDEIMISIKISKTQSKNQILLGYLNQITFGRGAYGIDAASRAYFGEPISQIKENEVDKAAFLATMINNPSVFSAALVNDKARASHPKTMEMLTQRYNGVLSNMSKYGFEPESAPSRSSSTCRRSSTQKTEDLSLNGAGYMKEAAEQFLAQMDADYPGSDPYRRGEHQQPVQGRVHGRHDVQQADDGRRGTAANKASGPTRTASSAPGTRPTRTICRTTTSTSPSPRSTRTPATSRPSTPASTARWTTASTRSTTR